MKIPSLLVIVRHAESERNVAMEGRLFLSEAKHSNELKRPDHHVALTSRGHTQATATGKALSTRFGRFDVAYDSGYRRTVETLDRICEAYEPEAQPKRCSDTDLRERENGYTWNMTTTEVATAFPWLQPYWDATGPFFARPPGGESICDVCVRTQRSLEHVFDAHDSNKVLLVSHGRAIASLRHYLEQWDIARTEAFLTGPSPRNAGFSVYQRVGNVLVLQEYDTVTW
jgi:2,3-bisphosphoglycerate-dependent phosphoglycerate mutase